MTYQEFKNKYNHKYVDYDGCYGYQCWDLAQFYFTEVLGLPSSVLSGCGVAKKMLYPPKKELMNKYFDEVPLNSMCPGDVCIWDFGEAGHIAMFDHWDGSQNWFFSQNPNPSEVINCNLPGLHAFRLKTQKEKVVDPVARDEYKNQLEVKVDDLRVRMSGSLQGTIIGKAKKGFYNYFEMVENQGYIWYRISDWQSQWVATSPEWTNIYPAKEKFKVGDIIKVKGTYKIVDTKDNMACVFMNSKEVWLPFESIEK